MSDREEHNTPSDKAQASARAMDFSRFSFDLRAFGKRLESSSEPIAVVIQGHLYADHVLVQFLTAALPKPEKLNIDRLGFAIKVSLCAALDLIDQQQAATLNNINRLRNKFSHDLTYEFSEQDKIDLFNTFTPLGQTLILETGEPGRKLPLREVPLAHIFIVLAILVDLGRQHFLDYQAKKRDAIENARRLLDEIHAAGISDGTERT